MTYGDVECERVHPPFPEAYHCRWDDRNRLALALLQDNKGTRTTEHTGIEGSKGITGRKFAMLTVEPNS